MQFRILRGNLAGLTAVASLIAVVKMGDTGAYTVGRLIGRHKMTPRLSPGKTMGGRRPARSCSPRSPVGSCCDCCRERSAVRACAGLSPRAARRWQWIAYGIIVGIAGMLGDLAESLIKRDAGRKIPALDARLRRTAGPVGLDPVRGAGGMALLGGGLV